MVSAHDVPDGGEFPFRSGIEFPPCACPMCTRSTDAADHMGADESDSVAMAQLRPLIQLESARRHEFGLLGRLL
ncbi:hypothetical protein [Streptomyces sp. NPDC059479]|uniref:hypothetical protein n=1 Tax=Streptomyces sp. NPDC059479 TaxID=3346848 RepID=UPI0036C26079